MQCGYFILSLWKTFSFCQFCPSHSLVSVHSGGTSNPCGTANSHSLPILPWYLLDLENISPFPGLESPGVCGCSWCKSHSTLLNILVNPSLNLFPSSYFWDKGRCALCGAILHLWGASPTPVAETSLLSNTSHSSEDAHHLCSWEPEHSWATGHSQAPSSDFGKGEQLWHPCCSWFGVDCRSRSLQNWPSREQGENSEKEVLEGSTLLSLFLASLILDGITVIFFSPSTPVLWNECHSFYVAQTHNNELCFYRLPSLIAVPRWELTASFMALLHIISPSTFPALLL